MLWWRLVILKGIDMFNGRRAIVTLGRCVPLHTTGLTDYIHYKENVFGRRFFVI